MATYQRITRAVKHTPLRLQVQAAAAGGAVLMILLVVGGLFLAEASRTATAGREVQGLEVRMDQLQRENAELRAELAGLRSYYRMSDRAAQLGYRPAAPEQVEYFVVDGYAGREQASLPLEQPLAAQAQTAPATPMPDFSETLAVRLAQALYGVNAEAAGGLP